MERNNKALAIERAAMLMDDSWWHICDDLSGEIATLMERWRREMSLKSDRLHSTVQFLSIQLRRQKRIRERRKKELKNGKRSRGEGISMA